MLLHPCPSTKQVNTQDAKGDRTYGGDMIMLIKLYAMVALSPSRGWRIELASRMIWLACSDQTSEHTSKDSKKLPLVRTDKRESKEDDKGRRLGEVNVTSPKGQQHRVTSMVPTETTMPCTRA